MAAAEIQSLIAWYYHASSTEQEGMWAALNGGKTKVRRTERMNPNKYEPMDWKLKENSRPGTKSS